MWRFAQRATLFFGFFACSVAAGQLTSTGDARLDRIRTLMATNLVHLPNYTCLMNVDRSFKPRGRHTFLSHEDTVRLEVAEVGYTELLGWPGSKLGEQEMEEMVTRGLFATGDFSSIANVVFRSRDPHFDLVGEKKLHGRDAIEYAFRVDRGVSSYQVSNGHVKMIVGYRGFFWADAETLELLRLETIIEEVPPSLEMKRATSVIDYQKSHIGEGDFLLPAKVDRTLENADSSMSQNVSTFTNCKKYETESVLRFDEAQQTPAAQEQIREVRLPAGVRLPLKLETVMDAHKSATGDPLMARTTAEVRSGDIVIPAGSEVGGRVRDLRRSTLNLLALQMEFTEIRAPGLIVNFNAFLEEAERRKGVQPTNAITIPGSLLVEEKHLNLSGMLLVYRTLAK
jgi:hypothetical protein